MKKILTTLLVIALAISLSVSAFAADGVGLSASATEVKAGETVTISLTLAETLTEVASFEYNIYYDAAAFEFVSSEIGGSNAGFNCDDMGGYFMVSVLDMTGVGITLNAGTICTLTFKAIADKEGAEFKAEAVGVFKTDWADIADGNVAVAQVSVTHDHVWGDAVVVDPTCKEDGSETRTCTIPGCGKTDVKVLSATGEHDMVKGETVAPTCTSKGYTVYTCSGCGTTENRDETAMIAHDYSVKHITVAGDCDTPAKYEMDCSVCGAHEGKEYTDDAPGHAWGDYAVTKEATCTDKGEETATCSVCGATDTKTIDELGHDYVEVNGKAPTCTEEGFVEYKCSVCGFDSAKIYDPVEHKFENYTVTKEATCTEDGEEVGTCAFGCGTTNMLPIDKLGHDWSDWKVTKEATKTEKGEKVRVCDVCGETETQSIDKLPSATSPKTGDEANIALWIVMALACGAGAVLTLKKKEN